MGKYLTLIALLLTGCAESMDRITATDFVPNGPGGFKFKSLIAPQYPDNETGEASRMKMLDGWLRENSMCVGGYEITSRQPVKRSAFVSDVYYEGRCKSIVGESSK